MPLKIWIVLLLTLSGCASTVPRALDDVRPGMDKDRVLETAGNPKRTFREAMQDHWIYTYFEKDQEWRRIVIFEDGKVVKITRAVGKDDWVKDLERSTSMEEFEHKARAFQKRAQNFKSIDGSSDQADEKK